MNETVVIYRWTQWVVCTDLQWLRITCVNHTLLQTRVASAVGSILHQRILALHQAMHRNNYGFRYWSKVYKFLQTSTPCNGFIRECIDTPYTEELYIMWQRTSLVLRETLCPDWWSVGLGTYIPCIVGCEYINKHLLTVESISFFCRLQWSKCYRTWSHV